MTLLHMSTSGYIQEMVLTTVLKAESHVNREKIPMQCWLLRGTVLYCTLQGISTSSLPLKLFISIKSPDSPTIGCTEYLTNPSMYTFFSFQGITHIGDWCNDA